MNKFNEGDLVRLKCGGPEMVIDRINTYNDIFCIYYDGDGRIRRLDVREPSIEKCKTREKPVGD